jgi:hypothetical protein
MKKTKIIIFIVIIISVILISYLSTRKTDLPVYRENILPDEDVILEPKPETKITPTPIKPATIPSPTSLPKKSTNYTDVFIEDFSTNYSVIESASMIDRTSPGWWLGSGAHFYSNNGISQTILGPLDKEDLWRKIYSISNPKDTEDGYYPQNVFRLVLTRHKWLNFRQELNFKVVGDNLSKSWNRNSSNGLLFFNRYQDDSNLYYTGIRVDGAAVIKKKYKGVYYDLALNQFYKNETYNRDTNPNLIPKGKWFGLRSEIRTNPDNTVTIKLYIDKDGNDNWVLAAQAKDDGKSYGGEAILDEGYTGIRTDFMDVQFDNYRVTKL